MAAMSAPAVLVGSDLLLASRLRAALGGLVTVADTAEIPSAGVVFVDLNQRIDERLAVIRGLRGRGGSRVIGFCNHESKATRIAAMEAGADEVVTNGTLPDTALRVTASA